MIVYGHPRPARAGPPEPAAGRGVPDRTSRVHRRDELGPLLTWSQRHSQSAFAWSWLGAAPQATNLHHVGKEQESFGESVLPLP